MRAGSGVRRSGLLAVVSGILAGLLVAGVAAAHPLGNFTINHYAGVVISTTDVRLDIVIDQAEIPTFQERRRLDTDGDGDLSDEEIEAAREPECRALSEALDLAVDGTELPLELTDARLSFPLGAGLPTMRLECGFSAALAAPIASPTTIEFGDRFSAHRLGWHEIVVAGDGVTIGPADGQFLDRSISARLTKYPDTFLTRPLEMERASIHVTPGGPAASAGPSPAPLPGSTEGLPAIFGAADLSPMVLLAALLTATGLGAFHALTPGHGKTLVAASLVATRGSAVHAVGLGLAVTVAHTLGVFALAAIVIVAQRELAPDVVVRVLPFAAAVGIVAIGAWMLFGELRQIRRVRSQRVHHAAGHTHGHGTGTARAPVTWRGLTTLGLAGGIVPSASALVILLGAIAAGRPVFGLILVVAFGVGMALVLGGVGVAIVRARGWVDRVSPGSRFQVMSDYGPLAASILVLAVGTWLTLQSLPALRF